MTLNSGHKASDRDPLALAPLRRRWVAVNRVTHSQALMQSQRQAGGRRWCCFGI